MSRLIDADKLMIELREIEADGGIGMDFITFEDLIKGQPSVKQFKPIKEGLPPIGVPLIVTIYDTIRFRRELRYPVYYQKSLYCNKYGFYMYGNEESPLLPEFSEVIAYMEMPTVYEEDFKRDKGE